jgi:hypothetical protein
MQPLTMIDGEYFFCETVSSSEIVTVKDSDHPLIVILNLMKSLT